jgi:amino-acid N-acetyltransferase
MGEDFNIRPAIGEELEKVKGLLIECGLHTEGVEERLGDDYVVAESGEEIIGVCGIEVYKPYGLLRSLAVSRPWRGRSAGRALVDDRTAWAEAEGIRALYLLTIDAENYFERFGFKRVHRDEVPTEIKGSLEFSSLCPETAVVMVKSLGKGGGGEYC